MPYVKNIDHRNELLRKAYPYQDGRIILHEGVYYKFIYDHTPYERFQFLIWGYET